MTSRPDIRGIHNKEKPKESRDYYNEAQSLSKRPNLTNADHERIIELLKRATDLKANCDESYHLLGKSYAALKQYNCAAFNFTMCIRIGKNTHRAYALRGHCNRKLGRTRDALLDYNEAIRQRPSGENFFARAIVHHDLGDYQEAIDDFTRALENDNKPKDVHRVHYYRGKCYRYVGKLEESVEDLKISTQAAGSHHQVHSADSTLPDAHNQLGISQCELGRYDLAKVEFTQAVDGRPDIPAFYNNRALALFHLAQYRLAADDLTKALECCDAFDNIAAYRTGTGQAQQVTGYRGGTSTATGSTTNNLSVAYNRAAQELGGDSNLVLPGHQNNRVDVIDAPNQNGSSSTNSNNAGESLISTRIRAVYLFHRGNCFNALGELDAALSDYEHACFLGPDSGEYAHHLGLTFAQLNRSADAIASFKRAIALDPLHFAAYFHLGVSLHRSGDLWASLEALNKVPDDKTVLCAKGKVKRDLGKLDEALEDLSAALIEDPDSRSFRSLRAHVLLTLGRPREALMDFSAAIARTLNLHSSSPILATNPDGTLEQPAAVDHSHDELTDPISNNISGMKSNTQNQPKEIDEATRAQQNLKNMHAALTKMLPSEKELLASLCYGRGLAWSALDHSVRAENDLSQAILLQPSKPAYRVARAHLFMLLGAHQRSEADLTASLQSMPAATTYDGKSPNNNAQNIQKQTVGNKGDESMPGASQADLGCASIDRMASVGHLFYLRGCIRSILFKEREAAEDFQASLAAGCRSSRSADLYYKLGISLARIGKHGKAAVAFDHAIECALIHGWRGLEGPLVVTLEMRERDISRQPTAPPHYYHERAKALQCAGHHVRAVQDFTEVLKKQKWNARALFRRGFSYKALGLLAEAADDLEAAKERDPRDPRLSICYRKLHNIVAITLVPPGMEDRSMEIPQEMKQQRIDLNASLRSGGGVGSMLKPSASVASIGFASTGVGGSSSPSNNNNIMNSPGSRFDSGGSSSPSPFRNNNVKSIGNFSSPGSRGALQSAGMRMAAARNSVTFGHDV